MSRVEVIKSKGCSRLFGELTTSSLRGQPHMASPSSYSSSSLLSRSSAPFSGLVICVTGLSKEARKQVMDATERLGGQYSPNLHPQCTHLVVQSYGGRKFEHALKHGFRNGLFVVTLGWFVDSVRRNVRLGESLYGVKNLGENGNSMNDLHFAAVENACLPVRIIEEADRIPLEKEFKKSSGSILCGCSLYIDTDISPELKQKVVEAAKREGATLLNRWFVGQNVSHVVCEATSAHKYLGHSTNLVTPLWVLKTAKESRIQKVVHVSSDLARRVGTMLDNVQNGICTEDINNNGKNISVGGESCRVQEISESYVQIVNAAKDGVRKRRCKRMQSCQTPIRPITPNTLLDSICWSISEPTSSASIYSDTSTIGDANIHHTCLFFDAKESEDSFVNFSRPLAESDKSDLILKNHFLTILFPVDRFSELGPYSRTCFSDCGFTCLKILDLIYSFYQEKMSVEEIEVAIHTDSKHADRLRSMYSSSSNSSISRLEFKRVDFLGSRKSLEMLKRVTGDHNSNVYELLIRA